MAECVLHELKQNAIEILAIIDRKGSDILVDFTAYKPNEISILEIDAIVLMPVDDYQPWYDMCLMSSCSHNIVANSSFSWWGHG